METEVDKDIERAIFLIQRILRMLSIKGNTKHSRYIRTSLVNLKHYQQLVKKGEVINDDKRRRNKAT